MRRIERLKYCPRRAWSARRMGARWNEVALIHRTPSRSRECGRTTSVQKIEKNVTHVVACEVDHGGGDLVERHTCALEGQGRLRCATATNANAPRTSMRRILAPGFGSLIKPCTLTESHWSAGEYVKVVVRDAQRIKRAPILRHRELVSHHLFRHQPLPQLLDGSLVRLSVAWITRDDQVDVATRLGASAIATHAPHLEFRVDVVR